MRGHENNGVGWICLFIVLLIAAFKLGWWFFGHVCVMVGYVFAGFIALLLKLVAYTETYHRNRRKNKKKKKL